ncbi:MAG: nucleotidyltransferase family protein [Hydrogenibacillus schlegelii]|uniref:Nucleotidyltransferase family protein n=1 Tax=Hydrogenibacillus schlegelii TaxID=1484 RepID=A0A947CW20_HYDSH|nr:nucleotidyltransferase family protein [Hydrogenibacillus schlegelii]
MNREKIIRTLKEHREVLRGMGVRSIALFGSAARDELGPDSDIDLLVDFSSPPGFDGYMKVKFYLEDVLGRRVDLVMRGALKPWAWEAVRKEAIDVP